MFFKFSYFCFQNALKQIKSCPFQELNWFLSSRHSRIIWQLFEGLFSSFLTKISKTSKYFPFKDNFSVTHLPFRNHNQNRWKLYWFKTNYRFLKHLLSVKLTSMLEQLVDSNQGKPTSFPRTYSDIRLHWQMEIPDLPRKCQLLLLLGATSLNESLYVWYLSPT